MKKILEKLLILALPVGQTQAAVINSGFQLTKGGLNVITDSAGGTNPFASYSQGVGPGVNVAGGNTVIYDDLTTSGGPVDMLGWTSVNGGNSDAGTNGVGGSQGLNIFAAWGGNQRIVGATSDTITTGSSWTISAQIDGPAGGPIEGDLAFYLMANGVQLTADAPLISFTGGLGFQTITRTYTNVALPGGVSDGDALTVMIGVEDTNGKGNRMIWDNVELSGAAIPEPSSALLLGLGGLALLRRKRA
ncbi:MAG: PEP-CTERM sorting domain-containing protein [Akkermansiaceae bacterium]|nr:PEP-CTERM sorting domain-containing protein [Akkermansiaceae bacterium]MDG2323254.1 PEP-CTERM sorting domain-containing protein [Akkermansiaceae bacterium]